jgi:hypothetical protein
MSITYFYVRACMHSRAARGVCVGGGVGCTGAGICLHPCSPTYPVCNAHALHCLRHLWLHHVFRHSLINSTIFGKKVTGFKMCFDFFLQRLFDTYIILRRIQRLGWRLFEPRVGLKELKKTKIVSSCSVYTSYACSLFSILA